MRSDSDSTNDPARSTPRCLSIDLEVGIRSAVIHQLAGLRGDNGSRLNYPPGKLPEALNQLDALADDAAFLLGHNLIAFDLPQLHASQPNRACSASR